MEFTLSEIHIFLLIPAVLAVITRYNPIRNMWIALSATSLMTVLFLSLYSPFGEAVILVAFSAFIGSTSPEIIAGTRNAIKQFLSNPKIIAGIASFIAIIYLLKNPELLESFIALAIVLGAIWIIVRPIFKGG